MRAEGSKLSENAVCFACGKEQSCGHGSLAGIQAARGLWALWKK